MRPGRPAAPLTTAILLGLGACFVPPGEVAELRFACTDDGACAEGWLCIHGVCTRDEPWGGGDGGACADPAEEEVCGNGVDDDCNGLTDCEEAACHGSTELCANGVDDDCDGLTDCEQAVCDLQACGPHGRLCIALRCGCSGNGGAAEPVERSCSDGVDNDCDGRIDCGDEDCSGQRCGDGDTWRCCGEGCVDVSATKSHCGGCGLNCKGPGSCSPVREDAGVVITGRCSCNSSGHCPGSQTCSANRCGCDQDADCGAQQQCLAGVCVYVP